MEVNLASVTKQHSQDLNTEPVSIKAQRTNPAQTDRYRRPAQNLKSVWIFHQERFSRSDRR
jgi:hypothetical protein